MSGGALDYLYRKVEDACDIIERRREPSTICIAFVDHLRKVSKALHDVEWVMSGDMSAHDDEPAMRHVVSKHEELDTAISMAMQLRDDLTSAIDRARK